jgi:hypothetical protein
MRNFMLSAMCVTVLAFAGDARAAGVTAGAGFALGNDLSTVELVQEKSKKKETIGEKIKRTVRYWTGYRYSFCVRCPIFLPLTAQVCTATGKSPGDARAKCVNQYPFCYVAEGDCR